MGPNDLVVPNIPYLLVWVGSFLGSTFLYDHTSTHDSIFRLKSTRDLKVISNFCCLKS